MVDAFAAIIEEAALGGVLRAGLAKLNLDVFQIHAFIAHRIRGFAIGNLEFEIALSFRVVEPGADAQRFIIGDGFLEIVHDDANVMHIVEQGQVPVSFTPSAATAALGCIHLRIRIDMRSQLACRQGHSR